MPTESTQAVETLFYCTFFPNLRAPVCTTYHMPWQQICDYLIANPQPVATKEGAGLLNFARYRQGSEHFTAANVLDVSAIGLDVDTGKLEDLAFTLRELHKAGLAFLFHTTFSHDPRNGVHKARFWLPLETPILGSAYKDVFRRCMAKFAPRSDSVVCDPSRRMFGPCYFPGDIQRPPRPCKIVQFHGTFLRAADLGQFRVIYGDIKSNREVSPDVLRKLAKRWSSQKSPSALDLSDRLIKALNGAPYAVKGERDTVTFQLASKLVETYPDISEKCVSGMFARSLEAMSIESPTDYLTIEQFEQKIINARRTLSERRDVSLISPKRQADIKQYFASDRTESYTIPEVSQMAEQLGVTREQLERCWILARDHEYFVLGGPKLRVVPCCREALQNVARVVLAPAPVETYHPTDNGPELLGVPELLERYSTPIAEVRRSMIVQAPSLDLPSGTLTIPVCPKRDLEPRHDVEVAKWFEILSGPAHNGFLSWLHFVTELSKPLAALVIIGARSAGKSLLARGLTRIWTTGDTPRLKQVLGDFNAIIETCPVVLSDESLPKDFRGREPIAELRELIQSTTRTSNQKYRSAQPLDGALRLILAANSHSILTIQDQLSGDDAPAFAERLFEITATDSARQYLESIGGREKIDRDWIEQDYLARHVLWLVENHQVPWVGRFGVRQDSTDLADRLIVRGGVRAKLCEFFVRGLSEGLELEPGKAHRGRGRLFTSIDFILSAWDRVMRRQNIPDTSVIASALAGISIRRVAYQGCMWYEVDQNKLMIWARETGYPYAP